MPPPHCVACARSPAGRRVLYHQYTLNYFEETDTIKLITVNPPAGTTYPEFKEKVDKLLDKTYMLKYVYNYEVRRDDDDDPGLHVHILCALKHQDNLPRSIRSVFLAKNFIKNKKAIDIQKVPIEWVADKFDYILGYKNKYSPETLERRMELDRKFRVKNGICQDYYIKCRSNEDIKEIHPPDPGPLALNLDDLLDQLPLSQSETPPLSPQKPKDL